jgi:[acyl-carrier-protein] S-malonyltransferase
MTKTAWLFPGQGSQTLDMGVDLKDTPQGEAIFTKAQELLGWSVLDLCQGDEEKLSHTLYTQPCLYVIESILVDLLRDQGKKPELVAGHSLGEYVALYAARVFDFESGLLLVKRRAELMTQVAGGKMAALMKFDRSQLDQAIANTPDVVLANDNSEQQVVISGKPEAVDQILEQVKVKKAVTLKVSGAFHSPLMTEAATQFQEVLESVTFQDGEIAVLSNIDPTPSQDAQVLKQRLMGQMTGSVRWREIMSQLSQLSVTDVVEVGPGKVLTGLIKRACPEINLHNVSNLETINL